MTILKQKDKLNCDNLPQLETRIYLSDVPSRDCRPSHNGYKFLQTGSDTRVGLPLYLHEL